MIEPKKATTGHHDESTDFPVVKYEYTLTPIQQTILIPKINKLMCLVSLFSVIFGVV